MLGILMYCLGVMYTPGPVNILSLNRGLQNGVAAHIPFCSGVGMALCLWFLLIGYTGSAIINQDLMPYISVLGVGYILYLAYKILSSDIHGAKAHKNSGVLRFRDGFFMQLLNPKSFLAVLPVTAVLFPSAGIEGGQIAVWSVGLSALGFGAPLGYAAVGANVSKLVENRGVMKGFNTVMGIMLIVVALDIAYPQIYLTWCS